MLQDVCRFLLPLKGIRRCCKVNKTSNSSAGSASFDNQAWPFYCLNKQMFRWMIKEG